MSRFLVFAIGFIIAILILKYRAQLHDQMGDVDFAERYLGAGGTNTLIVIIAFAVFLLSMMWALGSLQGILAVTIGRFF